MHVRHVAAVITVVSYRCRQQLLHCIINKLGVLWVTATASKVTPNPRDHPQLCIWHLAGFILLICDWKVQVSFSWHRQRLCLDACQCLYIISVKSWCGTDITVLQKHTHIQACNVWLLASVLVAYASDCPMKSPAISSMVQGAAVPDCICTCYLACADTISAYCVVHQT